MPAAVPGNTQLFLTLQGLNPMLQMPTNVTWARPIAPATTDPVTQLPLPNALPTRNYNRTFYGRQVMS